MLVLLALLGCDGEVEECSPMQAVFTDIDETLTTSDDESLAQLMDL